VRVGDVTVTEQSIVTPVGTWPLAGSQWSVVSQPVPVQATATWAIVVAVACCVVGVLGAFFTCGLSLFLLLGLLFLLVKTTRVTGPVMIAIHAGQHRYTAQEHVLTMEHAHHTVQSVNYAQQLAAGG
jgi:hypothetical protein